MEPPETAAQIDQQCAGRVAATAGKSRRLLVAALVAVASIAAAWWLSGILGTLTTEAFVHDHVLVVPRAAGTIAVLVAMLASIAVAFAALARLWRATTSLRRLVVGTIGLIFVPAVGIHGCTSSPDYALAHVGFQPAGDLRAFTGMEDHFWICADVRGLVRPKEGSLFADEYTIESFVAEGGDSQVAPLPVLGPVGRLWLVVTSAGVLGVRSRDGRKWVTVYDSKARRALGSQEHPEVPLLALLEPGEQPDPRDVSDLVAQTELALDWIRRYGGTEGFVAEDELGKALDDPRPAVREAATQIARAGGSELYPSLSARLGLPRKR